MNFADIAGQTLDEKYRIERELGRGGMGTVYLATHLGTERPVAVKIIAPQFMKRPEFVERFRREARAAGRLRHPNVVDVTDFGFSQTPDGQVAYLVMEYLDGCTLGEVLEEENNLPIGWTLDILEQVCSAVNEAHEQGIIHRDLKPDNIWLEPNQRGGYTVKVLDFGIAKLEDHADHVISDVGVYVPASTTLVSSAKATVADLRYEPTVHDNLSSTNAAECSSETAFLEKGTLIKQAIIPSESATSLLPIDTGSVVDDETVGTKIISTENGVQPSGDGGQHSQPQDLFTRSESASDLTRVGAVLGTPLYMSPEQCRGDKLDARSDIYSLGVIAYQMLSGKTPFSGDFTQVMESHKKVVPPPLEAKKVRKKLKRVIGSAMAKSPEDRPETAEAFASSLRSRSEGIFGLLRRAGMIYTEHMPKFVLLSAFFHIPMIALTVMLVLLSFLRVSGAVSPQVAGVATGIIAFLLTIVTSFCAHLITGTITWIVTQSLAVPLRPIKLRAALMEARKKWKTFAATGIFSTILSFVAAGVFFTAGFLVPFLIIWATFGLQGPGVIVAGVIGGLFGVYGFFAASVLLILVTPAIMMENLRGWQAMKRSYHLVRRSAVTAFAAFVIMFLIPMFAAGMISYIVNVSAKAFDPKPAVVLPANESTGETAPADFASDGRSWSIGLANGTKLRIKDAEPDMRTQLKNTILETLLQIFLLPIQIVVISFTAIIIALLYLKTRQAGGEPLQNLLGKFEETEQSRKKWQERVRQRLIQSGRIISRL